MHNYALTQPSVFITLNCPNRKPLNMRAAETSTQPSPTQPNPWIDPTHGQVCGGPWHKRGKYCVAAAGDCSDDHDGQREVDVSRYRPSSARVNLVVVGQ